MIRFVSQHAALFAALLLAMSLPASASPLEWRDVAGDIDQIVERREKVDFEISDSEGLASRRLSEMMDAAVGILADDGNSGYRARLAALREEMDSSRDRIAGLRFDMASAPKGDQSSILGYVGLAPASEIELGKQIAAEEDRLRLVEARYKETRSRFVDRLTSLGIDITPEQADGLLSMATADDIMAMHIAFANMKSINASLRDATVRADESLEIARRYYGIYTVMLEIALKMHDDFVSKVDAEYLTRLDTVRHRAASARADAERLSAATNDAALRRILSHNISAQAETLEAAVIYGNRLREQRNRMKETRARIAERHEVAVNTWRTVRLSSELVGMVRAAGQDFDVLMSLDIPDLRPFENRELQEEFGKISRELAPVS